ncbi:MAG: sugar ABC transporter permease [Chloroflexi bacterium]|nr:sugar ABC transporter permease [Chloroflexota bacterium]
MAATRSGILSGAGEKIVSERFRREIGKTFTVLLCIVPGMVVFFLFLLIPIFQSARYSLYDWNGFGPLQNYVGLDNYRLLFENKVFQSSVQHSFQIMVMSLGIQLPLAMAMALMVGRGKLFGRRLFRTILFIPFVFSEVITAIIWRYVLHPSSDGLVNVILSNIPGYDTVGWLADKDVVLYSIFAVITWKYFGFHMILYMAGLQAVSKDHEDAARIDGADEKRVLRYITLPLMGSTIRLTVFLSILGSFQQLVIIWVLTQGGPVNSSQVITTFLYKYGIKNFKLGYGSATAMILFAITLIFSIGYQRIIMKQDYGDMA